MIRIAATCIALFTFISPALAGVPQHPGQHHSVFASKRVCVRASFKTRPVPGRGNVLASVSINGHHVNGQVLSRHVVEWSGYGVIVRVVESTKRAPLVVRAASVRADCARVNVLASWR